MARLGVLPLVSGRVSVVVNHDVPYGLGVVIRSMAPASIPSVLRTPERNRKANHKPAELNVRSVVLGDLLIEPWFPSFYPQESIGSKVERLYVCKWCFKYSKELMPFVAHMAQCELKDSPPPGSLIYEHGDVAMHEIDGNEYKMYTQNLSLFAKLFLDTKSVFYDVTTFRYYAMTLQNSETARQQVVGFFSKEKMSWDNNNLACILVFPPWQRRGLGQILMGVSYELSRREGQLGGPEKPLSSLGRKAYMAYWCASVARTLASARKERTSIEDIVQQTWILHEDVISALSSMSLVQKSPRSQSTVFVTQNALNEWVKSHKIAMQSPYASEAIMITYNPSLVALSLISWGKPPGTFAASLRESAEELIKVVNGTIRKSIPLPRRQILQTLTVSSEGGSLVHEHLAVELLAMGPTRPEHAEPPPGTVYLVNAGSNAQRTHADIFLIPRPSENLADPLRWKWARKHLHLLLLVVYSILLGAITNSAGPIFEQLLAEYNTSSTSLNIGFAVNLLVLGLGNVVLIPISNKLGRRPIYLFSLIVTGCSQVWQAKSSNIAEFQVIQVLLGIGAAPLEALVALSIADVFFTHERGAKISYYIFGISLGTFIGPVAFGYIDTSQGWRWVFWWGAILSAILLVLFYFTFEETVMDRSINVAKECHLQPVDSLMSRNTENSDVKGANLSVLQTVPAGPRVGEPLASTAFRLQYGLWIRTTIPWRVILNDMWRPLKLSTFPAVLWCGFFYGTCISWLSVLAYTVANVFSPPPYSFSNSELGLFWISPMVGSVVGILYAGPLNDRFVLWKSRLNGGYREAEYLLWCTVPTALIMPAGLMLYGIASAHGLHWIVPTVGAGFVGFGLAVGGEISIAYTIDCYKMLDTQAVTTVILIRNIIGFAITWGIQPWIDAMGQQGAFILVGILSFVVTAFAVVFLFLGKRWRVWTKRRYEELVSERS